MDPKQPIGTHHFDAHNKLTEKKKLETVDKPKFTTGNFAKSSKVNGFVNFKEIKKEDAPVIEPEKFEANLDAEKTHDVVKRSFRKKNIETTGEVEEKISTEISNEKEEPKDN